MLDIACPCVLSRVLTDLHRRGWGFCYVVCWENEASLSLVPSSMRLVPENSETQRQCDYFVFSSEVNFGRSRCPAREPVEAISGYMIGAADEDFCSSVSACRGIYNHLSSFLPCQNLSDIRLSQVLKAPINLAFNLSAGNEVNGYSSMRGHQPIVPVICCFVVLSPQLKTTTGIGSEG